MKKKTHQVSVLLEMSRKEKLICNLALYSI